MVSSSVCKALEFLGEEGRYEVCLSRSNIFSGGLPELWTNSKLAEKQPALVPDVQRYEQNQPLSTILLFDLPERHLLFHKIHRRSLQPLRLRREKREMTEEDLP